MRDRQNRDMIYRMVKSECADCAVKDRCNHHCGCLNRQSTGYIDRGFSVFAPMKDIAAIADSLAEAV